MIVSFDVLFTVMEVLQEAGSIGDLSSMSKTCRTLQRGASKRLLDHFVSLRNDQDVLSFCLFMAADEGQRYPFLRQGLRLGTGRLSSVASSSLVDLLSRISNLPRLALIHGDKILSSNPRLPFAFARLSCVQHLEFSVSRESDYTGCLFMFKHMRSRLITASLDLPLPFPRYRNGQLNCALSDPISLLQNSAATLTSVTGTRLDARTNPSVVFPHVKQLTVELGFMPLISPYIVSFPNVTALDISCATAFDLSTLPTFSTINTHRQLEVGCWPALEALTGTLEHLYMMALCSKVEKLNVLAYHDASTLSLFQDVLSWSRPQHLQLGVAPSTARIMKAEWASLASVFSECDAARDIETLVVRVCPVDTQTRLVLDDVLVSVLPSPRCLPP